jgi:hypothetical protein
MGNLQRCTIAPLVSHARQTLISCGMVHIGGLAFATDCHNLDSGRRARPVHSSPRFPAIFTTQSRSGLQSLAYMSQTFRFDSRFDSL